MHTDLLRIALYLIAMAVYAPGALAHSDASGFVADEHDHAAGEVAASPSPAMHPATVRVDPRGIENVVLKVNARIVDLHDLYPGQLVSEGDVLAEFESAELETLQRGYIETHANMERLRDITITGEEKLIEGRMNLQWRGMSSDGVQYIEDMRRPQRRVPLLVPMDGFLLESRVVEGQIINAGSGTGLFGLTGATVFRIAASDSVLIEAALPLNVGALAPGMPVTIWISANGERRKAVRGWIDQVQPNVATDTQRRMVRMKPVPGPDAVLLHPGARVQISLDGDHE